MNTSIFFEDNGPIQPGVIVDVFTGGYVAQVSAGGKSNRAVWLTNVINGITGTSEITIPAIGSRVLVYLTKTGPYYILGSLPDEGNNDGIFHSAAGTDVSYEKMDHHKVLTENSDTVFNYHNSDRPMDTIAGDVGWINELGSVMSLLRGILVLKGTEESQVQIHHLDSLVRIISRNYEFLNPVIESVMYDKGGLLSAEIDVFKTRKELYAQGENSTSDQSGQSGEGGEQAMPIGLFVPYSRIKAHIGSIGNLLNVFVRGKIGEDGYKPPEDIKRTSAQITIDDNCNMSTFSTGDIGTYVIDELVFPERKVPYNEEKKTEETDFDALITEFEFSDGSKEPQANEKIMWDKDYKNNNYTNYEYWDTNKYQNPNIDKVEPNVLKKKFSKIVQHRDGSILIGDIAGSFLEMDGQGNINISCRGNLSIRTGKDAIVLAGRNSVNRAHGSIEQSATDGSVKIKAQDGLGLYANKGNCSIENNSGDVNIKSMKGNAVLYGKKKVITYGSNIYGLATTNMKLESPGIHIGQPGKDHSIKVSQNTLYMGAKNLNINATNGTKIKSKNFDLVSTIFNITGSSKGFIHGGGPKGTDVNHKHDVIKKLPATPEIKNKAKSISLSNSSTSSITSSYSIGTISSLAFIWTAYGASSSTFSDKIYESLWQKDENTRWSLKDTKDLITGSSPFPGAGYNLYMSYTIGENPFKAGEFKTTDISGYRVQ